MELQIKPGIYQRNGSVNKIKVYIEHGVVYYDQFDIAENRFRRSKYTIYPYSYRSLLDYWTRIPTKCCTL